MAQILALLQNIAAGDEVVFGKAGKETYGIGRFFSSLQNRVIPGLSFFTFAVIDVKERQSYPLQAVQMIKPCAESAKKKREKEKSSKVAKHPAGRPKGSRNKRAKNPTLSPELLRIQPVLQAFLTVLKSALAVQYLVMDGHFGNYPSAWMVLQTGLQFVSKLRSDAALYEPLTGKYCGQGGRPKYGDKVDVHIYQAILLNKGFAFSINVVVILKTYLATREQAHVILFSTDLRLP